MPTTIEHAHPSPSPFDHAPTPRGDPYDALAELFLGDTDDEPRSPRSPEPRAWQSPRTQINRASDDDTDTNADDQTGTDPPPSLQTEAPRRAPVAPQKRLVEALVLGHLPVMASPWALAYASADASRTHTTTAMLRLVGGHAAVDLFGVADPDAEFAADSLDEALRLADAQATKWIIRLDAIDEPEACRWSGVDAVTLLTGADETAIVGAYRTLKALDQSLTSEEDDNDRQRSAELQVAIMGADTERTKRAAAKLQRAAQTFLQRSLRIAPGAEQIGPTRARRLWRGDDHIEADDLLSLLTTIFAQRQPVACPLPSSDTTGTAGATFAYKQMESSSDAAASPAPARHAPSTGIATEGANRAPTAADQSPPPKVLLQAASAPVIQAGAALSAHLSTLKPLAARCPYADSIELATDARGALHALAPDAPDAIRALTIAAQWARDHARLLELTRPDGSSIHADEPIVRHLFTMRPPSVRRLLDTPIRLHALASAPARTDAPCLCVDLN